jgi:protein-tyrosine kinase
MSKDISSPDLVRRAAARLSEPVAARKLADAPVLETAAAGGVSAAARHRAPMTAFPKRQVTIGPAALAANGISLPSSGFSRTVEEFRVIKRQIISNAAQTGDGSDEYLKRCIMVTSATPGEGKTYTAINLALALAVERDLKVLLVDADVYRQSLLTYLGIKAEAGWIDLLDDQGPPFSDVLLHTNIPNLSVLPAGNAHPEVPELMSSRKMSNLVHEIASRYPDRFVIFDTLPCLVSSEPSVLANMVGQTIFVVAAHKTRRDQVEHSLRLINACPSVSLILNKATPILTERFGGYGYSYGYGYRK